MKKSIGIGIDKLKELLDRLNFFFIVHNKFEMEAMINHLNPLDGFNDILCYIDEESLQSYYIGKFFKYEIVLAQTPDMGSSNTCASINTVNRAVSIFKPLYIIMPGIAAALDNSLDIGDVVIADKVIGYEHEKIASEEIIGRWPEFRSQRLYSLFASQLNFIPHDGFRIKTGNYISGEKLLDNELARACLKFKFKEAKALDMEGIGLASASTFNRVYDWLLIKGISDYGDGKKSADGDATKDANQQKAMQRVIEVLKFVFDNGMAFSQSNLKAQYPLRKNVMISGSQCSGGKLEKLTEFFVEHLAYRLIRNNYNVITGYGKGVGPAIMSGIFAGCDENGYDITEYGNHFRSFVFPRLEAGKSNMEVERFKEKNRRLMMGHADVCVFVFGNKLEKNSIVKADGMIQELFLAADRKALILPIAATKGAAKEIYDMVIQSKGIDKYIKPYFVQRHTYGTQSTALNVELQQYVAELQALAAMQLKNQHDAEAIIGKAVDLINLYG